MRTRTRWPFSPRPTNPRCSRPPSRISRKFVRVAVWWWRSISMRTWTAGQMLAYYTALALGGCPRIMDGQNLTSQNAPGSTIGDPGGVLLPQKMSILAFLGQAPRNWNLVRCLERRMRGKVLVRCGEGSEETDAVEAHGTFVLLHPHAAPIWSAPPEATEARAICASTQLERSSHASTNQGQSANQGPTHRARQVAR